MCVLLRFNFRRRHDFQSANFFTPGFRDFPARQIKFPALRINHNIDATEHFRRLRLRRQTFRAADAEQFHAGGQLPALCQCNRSADARVAARPNADGNHLNFRA
jgi:hypothetical protein